MEDILESDTDAVLESDNSVTLSYFEEPFKPTREIRSLMSWDFQETSDELPEEISSSEIQDLEQLLVEDMLNILLGFDGRYVKANIIYNSGERRTFRISRSIQQPFIGMIERLLPAAADYSEIARFVEESKDLSAGRVNQALGYSFSNELIEYMSNVVLLEQVTFLDLNTIWSTLHKGMNRMHFMATICKFIRRDEARGGCTLSILHSCTSNCLADPEAQEMCLKWTKTASGPFFESLKVWLYQGQVFDPYDEFMIIEKGNCETPLDMDWEERFRIRKSHTPCFLESVATTILNTGRYIFCISKTLSSFPQVCFAQLTNAYHTILTNVQYEPIDFVYLNAIKRAHDYSNAILRQLFHYDVQNLTVEDFTNATFLHNLQEDDYTLQKLEFIKAVFCLQYGDMFYNIFENCMSELQKPADKKNSACLPKLIKECIRNSTVAAKENQKFCSEIEVELERRTLSWQVDSLLNVSSSREITGEQTLLEAMTLKVKVSWPLKVILNTRAIKFYQMIFRHIFYMKYVYKRLTMTKIVGTRGKHALKYFMIVFLQTTLTYMTVDTVETAWEKFKTDYCNTSNVLDLEKEHKKYIYDVLTGCMLTSSKMFKQLRIVLDVCLDFAENRGSDLDNSFESSLVTLIKCADTDARWSSFSRTLIPIFTNYRPIAELNQGLKSCLGDLTSMTSSERSLVSLNI